VRGKERGTSHSTLSFRSALKNPLKLHRDLRRGEKGEDLKSTGKRAIGGGFTPRGKKRKLFYGAVCEKGRLGTAPTVI